MKTRPRLAFGILLGAICGVALVVLYLQSSLFLQNKGSFEFTFEIAFGHFVATHLSTILTILGAIIGAAIGSSLAISKRCCAVLLVFIAGITIGGASMFFVGEKVVNWESGIWEDSVASERASGYLAALRAMDRATTNQFYITNFQATGRSVLAGYLHETEEGMQNWKTPEPMSFFTNSAIYHLTQKIFSGAYEQFAHRQRF